MCCCGKPNINGQPGYSWDGKSFSVRQIIPPDVSEGDHLLFDEPGRCGGLDSHCHHFRLVKRQGDYLLLVRHGGGSESITMANYLPGIKTLLHSMENMDSNARYWLMHLIYNTAKRFSDKAVQINEAKWMWAAAEKRIKTRKYRNSDTVRVQIEARTPTTAARCFQSP